MGHGNPEKTWISNLVKSSPGSPGKCRQVMENPGKLALCTNKIKFLSQVLTNAMEAVSFHILESVCIFKETGSNCPSFMDFVLYGPGKVMEF